MTSVSDGLVPWRGRAEHVQIGHLIQGAKKTKGDVWKVVDMRHPQQVEFGQTLWWKVVCLSTGEEYVLPPRSVRSLVTFMIPEESEEALAVRRRPPPMPQTDPGDSTEIMLLVEKLGAQHIATRDHETGEITCPMYETGEIHSTEWRPGIIGIDMLEHLRICHDIDTTGLEAITGVNEEIVAVHKAHADAHDHTKPHVGKGGFPHRHVPEDRSIL